MTRTAVQMLVAVSALAAALTGCTGTAERPSQTVAPTPSSAAPAPGTPLSPTEKGVSSLNPSGPNSFSPTVLAPRPATALPGNVRGGS